MSHQNSKSLLDVFLNLFLIQQLHTSLKFYLMTTNIIMKKLVVANQSIVYLRKANLVYIFKLMVSLSD